MIDFLLPLGIAIFGGNKFFCNYLCGRGQLFSKLGGDLKCSRNKPTPRWMSSKWFRYGFLIFFLTMFGNMVSEEKAGRLDVGYRQTAGKHIIIELKRADRIVTTSEMIKQVKKYHDALNKVLSAIYQTNYSFEILFVLGRPIDNNDSIENRELVANILKPMNARVVYYQELIENAYKAYNEYIAANKQSQPLIDMFSQLESSMDD